MIKTSDKDDNDKSKIWQDPRFSSLVNDPRFKQLPKTERKVKIDKRFQSMFHDEKFKIKYSVDKYGRKVNKTSSEDLKKYYDISSSDNDEDEEEDEEGEIRKEEKEILKDESRSRYEKDETDLNDDLNDDGEVLPDGIRHKLLDSEFDYARGEGRLLTDSSSDEESSETDDEDVFIEHVWGELDHDAPRTDESTCRLAACNMDWDRIRAVDIMVLCSSFLPPGGSILKVSIYPSEYGKERLAEEEIHGPPELAKGTESDSDNDDENLIKEQDSDAEEGDEYHMEKLRQYQLNRLKYYYAVIECDSSTTADKLYKECDGLEYESTATKLDLRFIPNDVSFDEDNPKEVCTELPELSKYKPRLFTTTALYQAKVDLTWDENSIERKELNEKLATGKLDDINDMELRKYVAYSSEDENEENNENKKKVELNEDDESFSDDGDDGDDDKKGKDDKIAIYKSLLQNINKKEEELEKKKYEMEYTWGVNIDKEKSDKISEEEKKNLTPIEKILEKKREKNKRRKEERKKMKKGNNNDNNDEPNSEDDLPDGIDLNDPYFAEEFNNDEFESLKKSKIKKNKNIKNKETNNDDDDDEEERKAKELELLLDDGEDNKEHFSLEKIQKAENESKSKKKRRKKLKKSRQEIEASKTKVEDNFELNVNDERFKDLFTSHLYNIDPTNSHFKKTKGMEKLMQEKFKRRNSKGNKNERNGDSQSDKEESESKRPKVHLENKLLVKSLKRKIKGNN